MNIKSLKLHGLFLVLLNYSLIIARICSEYYLKGSFILIIKIKNAIYMHVLAVISCKFLINKNQELYYGTKLIFLLNFLNLSSSSRSRLVNECTLCTLLLCALLIVLFNHQMFHVVKCLVIILVNNK